MPVGRIVAVEVGLGALVRPTAHEVPHAVGGAIRVRDSDLREQPLVLAGRADGIQEPARGTRHDSPGTRHEARFTRHEARGT